MAIRSSTPKHSEFTRRYLRILWVYGDICLHRSFWLRIQSLISFSFWSLDMRFGRRVFLNILDNPKLHASSCKSAVESVAFALLVSVSGAGWELRIEGPAPSEKFILLCVLALTVFRISLSVFDFTKTEMKLLAFIVIFGVILFNWFQKAIRQKSICYLVATDCFENEWNLSFWQSYEI